MYARTHFNGIRLFVFIVILLGYSLKSCLNVIHIAVSTCDRKSDKLIAAETADDISFTERFLEDLRNRSECEVAVIVTIPVVDSLEVVEVSIADDCNLFLVNRIA